MLSILDGPGEVVHVRINLVVAVALLRLGLNDPGVFLDLGKRFSFEKISRTLLFPLKYLNSHGDRIAYLELGIEVPDFVICPSFGLF